MSGVFQNIDPPTPSPPGECEPPPLVRGEDTLAGWRGGWGIRHSSSSYVSTLCFYPSKYIYFICSLSGIPAWPANLPQRRPQPPEVGGGYTSDESVGGTREKFPPRRIKHRIAAFQWFSATVNIFHLLSCGKLSFVFKHKNNVPLGYFSLRWFMKLLTLPEDLAFIWTSECVHWVFYSSSPCGRQGSSLSTCFRVPRNCWCVHYPVSDLYSFCTSYWR